MKLSSQSLRFKILSGALILLIPLGLALFFLYGYGNAQIQTALLEKQGLTATAPLMRALVEWQTLGVDRTPDDGVLKAMAEYGQVMPALAGDLAYNAVAMKATGRDWVGPQALADLVKAGSGGDDSRFAAVHHALASDLLYLADSSGLVLDPDIDSYYLVLGLYQALPDLLEGATQLRAFARPEMTILPGGAKLSLFARASQIQQTATKLRDEVGRSVQGVAASYGPVPGYEDNMKGDIDPIILQATAIQDLANQSAQAPTFNPGTMNTRLDLLAPLLQSFFDHGRAALDVMLDHRIASFTNELVTAFSVSLVGLAVGMAVLLLVVTGIRRRTAQLIESLGAVAAGDLSHEVPPRLLAAGDELGRLAKSVQVLQSDLRTQVVALSKVADKLSLMGSNLTSNTEESAAAIEQMSATSSQVARFAAGQQSQTVGASQIIAEMLTKINQSSELTQGMATQFFLFSQSMEANRRHLGATATEVRVTGDLTKNLTSTGEQGERSLESLRQSIGGVAKKTQEIQEIVQFILDIAERTNLLSMNAAIEAAHAGTSGRGFAVVADEIRKLAETNSKQAQNIKTLVDGIAEAAHQTLGKSEATGASFKTVLQDIDAVRGASQTITDQVVQQEQEDSKLSEGLQEFTRFYGELSESMDHQVSQSGSVQTAVKTLGESAQQISQSMDEQKIGMSQAAEAVLQVRDTTVILAQILEDLTGLMGRFKT